MVIKRSKFSQNFFNYARIWVILLHIDYVAVHIVIVIFSLLSIVLWWFYYRPALPSSTTPTKAVWIRSYLQKIMPCWMTAPAQSQRPYSFGRSLIRRLGLAKAEAACSFLSNSNSEAVACMHLSTLCCSHHPNQPLLCQEKLLREPKEWPVLRSSSYHVSQNFWHWALFCLSCPYSLSPLF